MGIDSAAAQLLCQAHSEGVSFRRTLTLGRQFLLAQPSALRQLARRYGVTWRPSSGAQVFADEFFARFLQTEELLSLDATSYEGASLIHDMNMPLPGTFDCTFDAVIDGGSLEHIFNLPVAISNCLRAIRVGGSFFSLTTANNFFGHGFYQFSPELFFRILTPQYGFELVRALIVEYRGSNVELAPELRWYSVSDPDVIRSRVTLINKWPVLLVLQARKLAHRDPLFPPYPQQSDYAQAWQHQRAGLAPRLTAAGLGRRFLALPLVGKLLLRAYNSYKLRMIYSIGNRKFFVPLPKGPVAPGANAKGKRQNAKVS